MIRAEASIGHNSQAAAELRSFVERIETVEGEIKEKNADKSDIYSEAKSRGYDAATIKKVVALRRKDPAARAEAEALLDAYMTALGMV